MTKDSKLNMFRKEYSIVERYRERINYSESSDNELQEIFKELKKDASYLIPVYCIEEISNNYIQFLAKAISLIDEIIFRKLNMRLYPIQVKAAMAMHEGLVVNMDTGEGKTLAGLASAFLNALFDKKVFMVTANEYLSTRDCNQAKEVLDFFELKVSSSFEEKSKKEIYDSDIIYTTSSAFMSDFLKSLTADKNDVYMNYPTQTNLKDNKFILKNCIVIIDEIDYVLLDEGNSLQGISKKTETNKIFLSKVMNLVKKFDDDFYFKDDTNRYFLSEKGLEYVCDYLDIDYSEYFSEGYKDWRRAILAALNALYKYEQNIDYIVKNSQVLLIDEKSGRVKNSRLTQGIHQMLEIKEGVEVKDEFRNVGALLPSLFYKCFEMMTGMSGTIKSDEEEMFELYNKTIIEIRAPRLRQRFDHPDVICKNQSDKINKIITRIKDCHDKGQPILCVVQNIKQGEELQDILSKENINAILLSAKNHEQEAEIIAKSGNKGNVTIATIMAGRGVDIVTDEEVQELGGLFVLGCSKFHSLRIDNQFRGRTGRQGAPGETEFYVSLDDEIAKGLANKMSALAFAQEKFSKARKNDEDVYESDFGMNKILDVYENAQREKERENRRVRKFIYDILYNTSYEFLSLFSQRNQLLFSEDEYKTMILKRLKLDKCTNEKELEISKVIKESWISFYETDIDIQKQIINKYGYSPKGLLEYKISNTNRWHDTLEKIRRHIC